VKIVAAGNIERFPPGLIPGAALEPFMAKALPMSRHSLGEADSSFFYFYPFSKWMLRKSRIFSLYFCIQNINM
jgi:hypothetical protein